MRLNKEESQGPSIKESGSQVVKLLLKADGVITPARLLVYVRLQGASIHSDPHPQPLTTKPTEHELRNKTSEGIADDWHEALWSG